MADLKKSPGGRETPQGELRPEVVEDEVPRSPVEEEPGGGGSNSSETKLSPREEEELDPRIQVRRLREGGRPDARLAEELRMNEVLDLTLTAGRGGEGKQACTENTMAVQCDKCFLQC